MKLLLHPRTAPSDRIRIWLGAFQATNAPALRWFLNGTETAPAALRQIASVRPDAMLSTDSPPQHQPRVFTGVYEFSGLNPNTPYTIAVDADGTRKTIETHTQIDQVPGLLEGSFNVLLVSCFHQREDPIGLVGIIVSQLKGPHRPHLSILMGDQVYLDLPTLQDFKNNIPWLAKKFEGDYTSNWQLSPGYSQVLAAAPSISVPDDHEFWNNYPHPSPFIGNSLTHDGRTRWRSAATALYEGFQLAYPAQVGEPTITEVAPLSFFFPDMRTLRDENRRFVMNDAAHQRMADWVTDVIDRRLFPVIVTGQSLFTDAAGKVGGSVGDFEMPNYNDFGRLMRQLERLADAGLTTLCLTGDVHFGRVVECLDKRSSRPAFYEIISSPSSLVTTIGADEFNKIKGVIGGIFGKPNPWPRHSDAPEPPDFLASDVLGNRFVSSMRKAQRGNNVALLRFSRRGEGLEFRITYWPISLDSKIGKPQEVGPFVLQPPTGG